MEQLSLDVPTSKEVPTPEGVSTPEEDVIAVLEGKPTVYELLEMILVELRTLNNSRWSTIAWPSTTTNPPANIRWSYGNTYTSSR